MIEILTLDTPSLGDRSYLVSDGEVAVVIDPQRDIDRVLDLAAEAACRITHVAETHIHNDYVTGGLALARRVGAEYLVAADDDVAFARRPVRDGDVIDAGQLRLRVLHTPGHTFTHLAYVLEDDRPAGARRLHRRLAAVRVDRPAGPLRRRSTPRPSPGTSTPRPTGWPRVLPGGTPVFPTHGFGSFCSADPAHGSSSTVAEECRAQPGADRGRGHVRRRAARRARRPTRRTTRTWPR